MDEVIEVESAGDVTVVIFRVRNITEQWVVPIREAIFKVLDSGRTRLVLDVSRVEFFSSAMLGTFIHVRKRWKPPETPVPMRPSDANSTGPVGLLFRSRLFEVYSDRESAVARVTEAGPYFREIAICDTSSRLAEIFRNC